MAKGHSTRVRRLVLRNSGCPCCKASRSHHHHDPFAIDHSLLETATASNSLEVATPASATSDATPQESASYHTSILNAADSTSNDTTSSILATLQATYDEIKPKDSSKVTDAEFKEVLSKLFTDALVKEVEETVNNLNTLQLLKQNPALQNLSLHPFPPDQMPLPSTLRLRKANSVPLAVSSSPTDTHTTPAPLNLNRPPPPLSTPFPHHPKNPGLPVLHQCGTPDGAKCLHTLEAAHARLRHEVELAGRTHPLRTDASAPTQTRKNVWPIWTESRKKKEKRIEKGRARMLTVVYDELWEWWDAGMLSELTREENLPGGRRGVRGKGKADQNKQEGGSEVGRRRGKRLDKGKGKVEDSAEGREEAPRQRGERLSKGKDKERGKVEEGHEGGNGVMRQREDKLAKGKDKGKGKERLEVGKTGKELGRKDSRLA